MWRSNAVRWSRGGSGEQGAGSGEAGGESGQQAAQGVAERLGAFAEDFLWQSIASLEDVEITVRFSGSPRGPSLRIGSNVGRVVATSLRRELGARIEQAERQVRQQVNRLVDQYVAEAESRVAALDSEVAAAVGVRLSEVIDVRAELERAVRRVIPRP
jgi:predicted component of type VI protein secretion system